MRSSRYKIGFVFILLGFFASVISFYFIIVGLPLFIVGSLFVLLSSVTAKKKLVTVIAPLVLWFPSTYLFYYIYGLTTPLTFLIPNNFQGEIKIVYSKQCGIKPTYENGRKLIEVPPGGLLIVNGEQESGRLDHKYYFIDEANRRIPIKSITDFTPNQEDLPAVRFTGSGMSSSGGFDISYSSLYVFSKSTEYDLGNQEKRDSMMFSNYKECLQKSRAAANTSFVK